MVLMCVVQDKLARQEQVTGTNNRYAYHDILSSAGWANCVRIARILLRQVLEKGRLLRLKSKKKTRISEKLVSVYASRSLHSAYSNYNELTGIHSDHHIIGNDVRMLTSFRVLTLALVTGDRNGIFISTAAGASIPMGQGGHVPPIFGLGGIITNVPPPNISRVMSATFYPCNIFLISWKSF